MNESSPLETLYTEELYRIKEKLLIIITRPWEEILDEEKILLTKILGAMKLSLGAVQVLTYEQFKVEDFNNYPTSCIIAFGAKLRGPFEKYELITLNNKKVIIADELRQLNDTTKRNLWLALKQVFQS